MGKKGASKSTGGKAPARSSSGWLRSLFRGTVIAGLVVVVAYLTVAPEPFPGGLSDQGQKTPVSPSPLLTAYVPEYRFDHILKNIDAVARRATELILFSLEPRNDGSLSTKYLGPHHLDRVRTIKEKGIQSVLVSIGGAGRSGGFRAVAFQSTPRKRFISEVVGMCEKYGLDGVDIDWEQPQNNEEVVALGLLLHELRKALRPKGLLLTVALHVWQDIGEKAYGAVDRVHLMTYDMQLEKISSMRDTEKAVQQFLGVGLPAGKLVVGVPAYGRSQKNPGDAATYADIVQKYHPKASKDLVGGITFNGIKTCQKKAAFVKEKKLGGVMVWEAGQDTLDDETSLLAAIRKELDAS